MSTNWETADVLEAPMEIAWQFDYAISIDKLRNLYSKAKRLQWDAERDLDWDVELDAGKPIIDEGRFAYDRIPFLKKLSETQRETFRAHVAAHALSQFLHGEQGALMTAAALTHAVPDYEAKLYAATQTMDEARHVEAYERYVAKLAIVYPLAPWLKDLIDRTLTADHWVKTAIGMNMVIESLALGAFHNMMRATRCDLLRSITALVLRDEARHVAYGNVYVGETIKNLHPDEREDIADFAFTAIKQTAEATGGARGDGPRQRDPGFLRVLENSGIDPRDFLLGMREAGSEGVRAEAPPGQVHSFKDLMMPALVRVGAVTPRTRKQFLDAGIPVYEDASVLESMEDGATGDIDFSEAAREFES